MRYWHTVKVMSKKKKKVLPKRVHGKPLQTRWDGQGLPPVMQAPPQRGAPSLERSHPFFFNMNPGIMSGPSCNHDVGVLAKLPVLSEDMSRLLMAKCRGAIGGSLGAAAEQEVPRVRNIESVPTRE